MIVHTERFWNGFLLIIEKSMTCTLVAIVMFLSFRNVISQYTLGSAL